VRAPASESDLSGHPLQGQHMPADTHFDQTRAPPSGRPAGGPGFAGIRRKDITWRYTVVAASTLLGIFLLISTGEWKLLLMNLSFLPLLAVGINLLIMGMRSRGVQQLDDVVGHFHLEEVLGDIGEGLEVMRGVYGEFHGKDLRVEASKMMKQVVYDFTPVLMDQMSKRLEDVLSKQSGKMEDVIASKAARVMEKAVDAFESKAMASFESGPGKTMMQALKAVQNLQSTMESKNQEFQAFEKTVLAALQAQQSAVGEVAKASETVDASPVTQSAAEDITREDTPHTAAARKVVDILQQSPGEEVAGSRSPGNKVSSASADDDESAPKVIDIPLSPPSPQRPDSSEKNEDSPSKAGVSSSSHDPANAEYLSSLVSMSQDR